jgi:hypothetical protein
MRKEASSHAYMVSNTFPKFRGILCNPENQDSCKEIKFLGGNNYSRLNHNECQAFKVVILL